MKGLFQRCRLGRMHALHRGKLRTSPACRTANAVKRSEKALPTRRSIAACLTAAVKNEVAQHVAFAYEIYGQVQRRPEPVGPAICP
jgi:hypothetical protein